VNLAVLGDRVLVRAVPREETITDSGLIALPEESADVMGTVIACADGLDVKTEDVVIFPPSAGQVLEHEGERYIVLGHDEILAVVEE